MMKYALVGIYLIAIVLANLSVQHFGPQSVIINSILFIGLDLSTRDKLHDLFQRRRFWWIAGIIVAGSIITYLINRDAASIALASCIAFAAASIVDTGVYIASYGLPKFNQVMLSNTAGSIVDTVLFLVIAFGSLDLTVAGATIAAKIVGGLIWSIVLFRSIQSELTS